MKDPRLDLKVALVCTLLLAACLVALAPARADAAVPHLKLRKYKQSGSTAIAVDFTGYYPYGSATNSSGQVFVACSDHKIRKFTSSGAYLNYIGLANVNDVDVDSAGNIWAVNNVGVYEFSSTGHLIRHWAAESGRAIEVDRQGYVFFSDDIGIQRCKTNGTKVSYTQIAESHGLEGTVVSVVSTANHVWDAFHGLISDAPPDVQGYKRTSPSGVPMTPIVSFNMPAEPTSIANDSAGYLYTAAVNGRVYKYNQAGSTVKSFPTGIVPAFNNEESRRYAGIDVDPAGYIWVAGL